MEDSKFQILRENRKKVSFEDYCLWCKKSTKSTKSRGALAGAGRVNHMCKFTCVVTSSVTGHDDTKREAKIKKENSRIKYKHIFFGGNDDDNVVADDDDDDDDDDNNDSIVKKHKQAP